MSQWPPYSECVLITDHIAGRYPLVSTQAPLVALREVTHKDCDIN